MGLQRGESKEADFAEHHDDDIDCVVTVDCQQWILLELKRSKHSAPSRLDWLKRSQQDVTSRFARHWAWLSRLTLLALVSAYGTYLGFVFARETSGKGRPALVAMTSLGVLLFLYEVAKVKVGQHVESLLLIPCWRGVRWIWVKVRWVLCPGVLVALIVYLSVVVVTSLEQGLALLGYIVFTSLALITSTHVNRIQWQPVVVGLSLQVALSVLFLRFGAPYRAALWLTDLAAAFLKHSLRGATTSFGNPTAFLHPLFMVVCPTIMYVGAAMAFFSHIGVTPYIRNKLSCLFWLTFGMSRVEAHIFADSILSGMMDYVVKFRWQVSLLTPSELQMTLVLAHSNLSAFMYSIFSIFWVPPEHLLLGAFLAVPAGVALCKMNAPEVHQTYFRRWEDCSSNQEDAKRNVFEQTALGAWQSAKVTASIIAQVTAFMSMYQLFDAVLIWFGNHANIQLNFKVIFGHLLVPVTYLLGVPSDEVAASSYILGLRLTQNELIGYLEMGVLRMANSITRRSAAVTTVALSSFSCFASMTIVMGNWPSTSPATYRRGIQALWRVYFITNLSALSTACLFGVLYDDALICDFELGLERSKGWLQFGRFLSIIPSYEQLLPLVGINV